MRDRIELLQGISIFGGVHREALELLLERSVTVEVPKDSWFFREGDPGNTAFALERGKVAILKYQDGEEYLLRTLDAGDCFGEVALLDFFPRSASVLATENSRALQFHSRDLLEVARKDGEAFALIYMNIARELARRLRDANDRIFRARIKYRGVAEGWDFRTT